MRRTILGCGLALVLIALTGCGDVALCRATERLHLDVPWDGCERIVVRTSNGDVGVFCEDRDDIRINAVKRARGVTWAEAQENLDRLTIVARADENDPTTFRIEFEAPPELTHRSPGVSFEIYLPTLATADVATANGYVRVRGVTELAQLQSSNGRIIVEDVEGRVDADTSNGRIVVKSVVGDCHLNTSNGGITVRDARGSVEATTSNGSISVQATPAPDGRIVLRTSNGDIRVIVPQDLPADLLLDTSNGRARVRLCGASLKTSTHSSSTTWGTRHRGARSERFEAKINGGGCRIEATTSNGSVTLDTQ